MYPEINLVAQSGIVRWPVLRYNEKGSPEFRFTLAKSGAYPWSIPCCAVGHTAEKLAGDLDEGMPIIISAAELCYRKRQTKAGEVSRMEILVWRVQVGHPDVARVAQDEHTAPGEDDSTSAGAIVEPEPTERATATKARRPRVPKHLTVPYTPNHN